MAAALNDEDLAAFVDPETFGEEIILPGGGRIFGLIDERADDARPGMRVSVDSVLWTLTLTPKDACDLMSRELTSARRGI